MLTLGSTGKIAIQEIMLHVMYAVHKSKAK